MNIAGIIALSDLLAKLQTVKRATRLPSGDAESDSHHSFSLALIAYDICQKYCPELAIDKVVQLALVHDLLEIVTGDEDTLHASPEALEAKRQREAAAMVEFDELFADYPTLRNALHEYERLDTAEAATVFVLDKACTTWTHHHDRAEYARLQRNLHTKQDIADWAERQRVKFQARLTVLPPQPILDVYEQSFEELSNLYNA